LIANDFGAILTSRPDASRRPQGWHALGNDRNHHALQRERFIRRPAVP